ncbi:MAG: HEAT repeat domain-containing protein [Myxococcales bacterium]|nr:HEAT repeat domain-containing protein [Myxococcales bacterium]MCB9749951.1 HEAT repeat domain-containing protein [Myxococcales bacterium]
MRKLALPLLVTLAMLATPACKDADPNKFETYIERIKSDEQRGVALGQLEALVKTVASSTDPEVRDARTQEFVDKVIPVFEETFENAQPVERTQMLEMLRVIGRPEGANIWSKALVLDGSDEGRKQALLAIQGIINAKAIGTVDALVEQFTSLVNNPTKDKGKREGEIRIQMAEALGELGDAKAVPALIASLEKTKEDQPVAVHRQAAKSLGLIGDPSAVDALITVNFRVPDSPSTTDIGNRSKLALVGIGKPAIPRLIEMLQGKHEEVNALANENGVDLLIVQQTAAGILGNMGATEAIPELLAFMPRDGCVDPENPEAAKAEKPKKKKGDDDEPEVDPAKASLRAFVARSLGYIGDESASKALCSCVNATHNAGDMDEVIDALGRIGGEEAFACLIDTVKNGEYDPETVVNSEFVHQPKWLAARWSVLVASPDKIGEVKSAFEEAGKLGKVQPELDKLEQAIKTTEECGGDKACWLKVLQDANADVVAREKAAYELNRLAKGDVEIALEVSKAFKVRDADARVTMAMYADRIADGKKCPECVQAFEDIMEGEKGSMDATMQLPVLTARNTMAKLR